jgi:hypothetical protein
MRHRVSAVIVAATLAASIVGCEGKTSGLLISGPTDGVRVRMLNALSSSASLDYLVDNQVSASGVAYGNASPYVSLTLGSHRLQARSSAGTTLVDFTRDLNAAGSYSFIPAAGLSQSGALLIADDATAATGQGKVRVVHVAAAQGAVSVYVTSATADLSSATPVVPSLPFGTASSYAVLASGSYRVRVTAAGNPNAVLLDTGNIVLGAGTVRTLMLTDAPGGGLPTTLSVVSDAN